MQLRQLKNTEVKLLNNIANELKVSLSDLGQDLLSIQGRIKSSDSIFAKLKRTNTSINDLHDILGFRIIVKSIKNCYDILQLLHEKYHKLSDLTKDYIKSPKKNGYQSLHTVIILPCNRKIEVQIRTEWMDYIAEHGSASHDKYKQETYGY